MSMEFNHESEFFFPWQIDEQGEYLGFIAEEGTFYLRHHNTRMFLFPEEKDMDHIFVVADDEQSCLWIWRQTMEDRVGPGAFGALCDQLFEKGFNVAEAEEPSPLDIRIWEQSFDMKYLKQPTKKSIIDGIVEVAMKNIDCEWKYVQDEDWFINYQFSLHPEDTRDAESE